MIWVIEEAKVPGTSEKAVCPYAEGDLESAFVVKSSVKVPGT
jgi:hypothetical protein